MKTSEKIRQRIKHWEGRRLKAYRCAANVLTIGYGHTGADVNEGHIITEAEADEIFARDIERFEKSVSSLFADTALTQNQFDALVSLSWNIGALDRKAASLVRRVKANPNDPAIRAEFLKYSNAKVKGVMKQLPGLVARRTDEANHYFNSAAI